MWISTSAVRPSAFSANSTIFQAVLRLSVGTRLSFEVSRIAVALRRASRNRHNVVQLKGLVDGGQPMETIGARRSDAEAKVDLCVRTDGGGHTQRL